MIREVIIHNFRSIKELRLSLRPLNVLIGVNGAGKSNFIEFFELTKALYEGRLGSYTLGHGGIDRLLYHGRQVSESIRGLINFEDKNAFFYEIKPAQSSSGYIEEIGDYFNNKQDKTQQYEGRWHRRFWEIAVEESTLKRRPEWRAKYLQEHLESFSVYHFHDTSHTSPMRRDCKVHDNSYLKVDGSNLAAYLYHIQQTDVKAFRLIEHTIRSIAPYFKGFKLNPDRNNSDQIRLEWEELDSDMYLDGYSFSDGTLRFIALTTLLLQPKLPKVIIIDEPELGLHPAAINKLAAMVKRASRSCQVILSTQSVNLVNQFEVEDIITVDREERQTILKHLDTDQLKAWLSEYEFSLGELWEKNMIGGQL